MNKLHSDSYTPTHTHTNSDTFIVSRKKNLHSKGYNYYYCPLSIVRLKFYIRTEWMNGF